MGMNYQLKDKLGFAMDSGEILLYIMRDDDYVHRFVDGQFETYMPSLKIWVWHSREMNDCFFSKIVAVVYCKLKNKHNVKA
jgi:hypothetical protein